MWGDVGAYPSQNELGPGSWLSKEIIFLLWTEFLKLQCTLGTLGNVKMWILVVWDEV
jgi:hypothetical protein